MARTHILGFPRIGAQRELKFALEAYWRGEADEAHLRRVAGELARSAGKRSATPGSTSSPPATSPSTTRARPAALLGALPQRFGFDAGRLTLAQYFALARGNARAAGDGDDQVVRHELSLPRAGARPRHALRRRHRRAASTKCSEAQRARHAGQAGADRARHVAVASPRAVRRASTGSSLLPALMPAYRRHSCAPAAQRRRLGAARRAGARPRPGAALARGLRAAYTQIGRLLGAAGAEAAARDLLRRRRRARGATVARCRCTAFTSISCARRSSSTTWRAALPARQGALRRRRRWAQRLAHRPASARLQRCSRCTTQLGERLWVAPSCSLLHVPVSLAARAARSTPKCAAGSRSQTRSSTRSATARPRARTKAQSAVASGARGVGRKRAASRRSSERVHNALVQQRVRRRHAGDAERAVRLRAAHRAAARRARICRRCRRRRSARFRRPRPSGRRAPRSSAARCGALDYLQRMRAEIEHAVARAGGARARRAGARRGRAQRHGRVLRRTARGVTRSPRTAGCKATARAA